MKDWSAVTSRAAAGLVAGIAGFASYNHIVKVAREAGEHISVAAVLPLSIDGLIVVGTMAMIDDKRHGRQPRLSARVALGFGVVATLAANVASARDTVTARLVAAVPALAFLIAVEVLARTGRKVQVPVDAVGVTDDANGEPVRDPWDYAVPIGPEPAEVSSVDVKSGVKRVVPKAATNAERVARIARRNPSWSVTQIAAKADVSEATARRHIPADHQALKRTVLASPTEATPAETPAKTINGNEPELHDAAR